MSKIKLLRKNDTYLTKTNRINEMFIEFEIKLFRELILFVEVHKPAVNRLLTPEPKQD
jgi:hypothetical protein